MSMQSFVNKVSKFVSRLVLLLMLVLLVGCEDDDGGGVSGDTGDNNRNVAVALGDSITSGQGVAPYPGILAGMSGKQVVNAGVGGARSAGAGARAESLLNSHHPAYMFILMGSNDAIHGGDPEAVKNSLAAAIGVAIEHQTIPIIATMPPMTESHSIFNGGAEAINDQIRALASETGTPLVDLESAFNSDPSAYLQADGLHPNQAGQELIAQRFSSVF